MTACASDINERRALPATGPLSVGVRRAAAAKRNHRNLPGSSPLVEIDARTGGDPGTGPRAAIRTVHIEMTDRIRTFVACELPREIRSDIGRLQEELRRRRLRPKWVRPENLHLTLRFLGEVSVERIQPIAAAIENAARGFGPLSLSAKGIGVFPGVRRARVIWVGIGGQFLQLEKLQAAVADELDAAGFPADNRPYKGHLTIGRIKKGIDARLLAESLTEFAEFETAAFTVDEVVLFRSRLNPEGPVYTRLRTIKLDTH